MSQSVHESGKRVEMSANLGATLQRAGRYAAEQRHRFVTIEHILFALNEDPEAELMLSACSIDQSRLHNDVLGYLNLLQDRVGPQENMQPVLATEAARIINSAVIAAQKSGRDKVNGAIVLAAIIGDGKTPAANILSSQGLTFQAAIQALQAAHGDPQMGVPAGASYAPYHATGHPAGQMPVEQPVRDQVSRAAEHAQAAPSGPGGSLPGADRSRGGVFDTSFASEHRAPQHTAAAQRSDKTATPVSQADQLAASSLARFERRPSAQQQHSDQPSSAGSQQPVGRPQQPSSQQSAEGFQPARPQPGRSSGLGGDPIRRTPPPEDLANRPYVEPYKISQNIGHMPSPESLGSPTYAPAPPVAGAHGGGQFDAYGQAGHVPDYRYPQHSPYPETSSLPVVVPDDNSRPTRIIRAGQLLENIPRRMRFGVSHSVEVRIARSELQNIAMSMHGHGNAQRHELVIAKIMAVRMRAPDDGFFIEAASPETQWIENPRSPLEDEFASWRWIITPKRSGRATLQLIVSARTIGGDGLPAETALPDQLFDIRISTNYAKVLSRWTGWVIAAVLGGILATFGEDIMRIIAIVIRNGTGGGGL